MTGSRYLGDGLYCDHDGYQFRLFTERDTGLCEIFLEPGVVQEFLFQIEKVWGVRIEMKKVNVDA